jgi:tetratricopeptide (TPR) repeat protein
VNAREAAREIAEGNRLRAAGSLEGALAAYRRAVSLTPDAGNAHYNLGIALRQSGDLRGAALAFRAAARLDASDLDAVQNVVETLALGVERGERLFQPVPHAASAQPQPVSVIVCSIDETRLASMQASFRAALGTRPHEFVVIRDAASLCEGYERGARAARHETLVFSHDDVTLDGADAIAALERALASYDIVGLAGSRVASGPAFSWAGHPHLAGSVCYPAGERWKATIYSLDTGVLGGMQALDGFLFASRRAAALSVGFDAATFDGFHFSYLDFVYRAHRAGLRIAVTTEVLAVHASEGSFGEAWRGYAERFVRKFPELSGPQGKSFYFGREFARREHLARFHEEYNGLGAAP